MTLSVWIGTFFLGWTCSFGALSADYPHQGTIYLSELQPRHMRTSEEIDRQVEQAAVALGQELGSICQRQNAENRSHDLPACFGMSCLVWAEQIRQPPRIEFSLGLGTSPYYGVHLTFEIQWAWGHAGRQDLSMCYHPLLTPTIMHFKRDLRVRLMGL